MTVFDEYGPQILRAFLTTIELTLPSALLALLLGTVLAAMRVSPVPVLRAVGGAYVELMRNTPLTLVILFCSLGLAQTLGVTLVDPESPTSIADSAFRLSILGLGAYTATFVCEVLRGGINTVAGGQAEAARALGFTFDQTLRLVVLPQAFRAVIAPLGSVFIALLKNSTVAAIIGVGEAALLMKEMIENLADIILIGAIFAGGFMILTIPTGLLFGYAARRLAVRS
jgi:His/Glu/Gln/Arg/opine family amino acid ABC transporter permease subunit